ncbi:Tat pathway signal sequence domain protein [Uliginosibacterium sediminicola]|uniref:Tat pathway signal sequence domain protein n=1 Tax=Uliginosibacterium sediminicola TaxID=2024550 RepID=A0ABU9YYU6_9RHOO
MEISRRSFLKIGSLLASSAAILEAPDTIAASAEASPALKASELAWLEAHSAEAFRGSSWGLPWAPGSLRVPQLAQLALSDARYPLQSWPLAYWPDGSLKWTAHALAPAADGAPPPASLSLAAGQRAAPASSFVSESADTLRIDTGKLRVSLSRRGKALFDLIEGPGQSQAKSAHLVALVDVGGEAENESRVREVYESAISELCVENAGPARVVVKARGSHRRADGREVLPFTVRLYFYRNSDAVRIVHSFVFDLDEQRESIRGLGLRFGVPLAGPAHERYVRFVGDNGGVFAEAVRGLTGLRRDPGAAATTAQLRGERLPELKAVVSKNLNYIPAFGDYSLQQTHPDGFSIAKRTAAHAGWLHAASGSRAAGTGYLGTPAGGVAFGLRNFWQSYPAQLDIQGAASEQAAITLWLWSPAAPGMDLRFYHDGLGQDDYAKQLQGLDITYEDYEPGFGRPYGVARSSELELQLTAATPAAEELLAISRRIQTPPQLTTSAERLKQGQAFDELWAPASHTPASSELERQLAWCFDFYRDQIAQRKWYGFWDYGDVMHTYDTHRHVWRYDVGGFAWDNSELSTETWLWHYYLFSGRSDVFRLAEAMTRHVSEVDVHHAGPFSPLGSRHNVQHWGDSAKQLRISTALNTRFFYYLTADELAGDLLHEQADAVNRLQQIIAGRKVGQKAPEGPDVAHQAAVSFGTDWGAVSAAWFTEWERTGNTQYRDKLLASMATIAAQPKGFFTGGGIMDLRTGAFLITQDNSIAVSHLSAAFGLPEICSELIRAIPDAAFRKAWLDYCVLYNASAEEQTRALGKPLGPLNLGQGHAKLLGYAGRELAQPALRQQAWKQFFKGQAGILGRSFVRQRIDVPQVLNAVDEAPDVSTNAVAQWGLAAISLLATAAAELPGS